MVPVACFIKNITIINDTSRVIRMMPQLGASIIIVIMVTLEVIFMLLESSIMLLKFIYSTGTTHDNHHLPLSYFYSTGHWIDCVLTPIHHLLAFICLSCSDLNPIHWELPQDNPEDVGVLGPKPTDPGLHLLQRSMFKKRFGALSFVCTCDFNSAILTVRYHITWHFYSTGACTIKLFTAVIYRFL